MGLRRILSVGATSTIRPAYMMAIRSDTSASTARSWEITRKAADTEVRMRLTSSRICAWTVTSTALVGSSMIMTSGLFTNAIAMTTRCRIPPPDGQDLIFNPEQVVFRRKFLYSGFVVARRPQDREELRHLRRGRPCARKNAVGQRCRVVDVNCFGDLKAHGQHGVQAGHGLLEDHRDAHATNPPHGLAHAPQNPLVLLRVEPTADALPIFARKVHQVLVVEDDLALRERRIPREEGHHRQAHGGVT